MPTILSTLKPEKTPGQMTRPPHGYIQGLGDFLGGEGCKVDPKFDLKSVTFIDRLFQ